MKSHGDKSLSKVEHIIKSSTYKLKIMLFPELGLGIFQMFRELGLGVFPMGLEGS